MICGGITKEIEIMELGSEKKDHGGGGDLIKRSSRRNFGGRMVTFPGFILTQSPDTYTT